MGREAASRGCRFHPQNAWTRRGRSSLRARGWFIAFHFAMMQKCSISSLISLRALGALGSRAGWSCLGDLEEAPSPLSKVPDFGLMLVTVSAMVNLRSRTEWEEAGRVRDPTLAQQVLGVLSPGWLPPDSLQSRAEGRASSHESWGSPAKPRPLMAAVDLTASLSPAPSLLQLPPSTCSQSS